MQPPHHEHIPFSLLPPMIPLGHHGDQLCEGADDNRSVSLDSTCPQSVACGDPLQTNVQQLDESVVDRILDLEKIDVASFLPCSSPVSVDMPVLDPCIPDTPSNVADTIPDTALPPPSLQLISPQQQVTPPATRLASFSSQYDLGGSPWSAGSPGVHSLQLGQLCDVENLSHQLLDPAILDKKSALQVMQLFYSRQHHLATRVKRYWVRFRQFHNIAPKVSTLLNNKGLKLKRKKRMGTEVSADEKKLIRAQRNRERSQALRRYQKQRLIGLENSRVQLKTYNSAVRSVINCMLEDDRALPLLQAYFARNKCSEQMLAFLSHEE